MADDSDALLRDLLRDLPDADKLVAAAWSSLEPCARSPAQITRLVQLVELLGSMLSKKEQYRLVSLLLDVAAGLVVKWH
jgi:hypothetical protein